MTDLDTTALRRALKPPGDAWAASARADPAPAAWAQVDVTSIMTQGRRVRRHRRLAAVAGGLGALAVLAGTASAIAGLTAAPSAPGQPVGPARPATHGLATPGPHHPRPAQPVPAPSRPPVPSGRTARGLPVAPAPAATTRAPA